MKNKMNETYFFDSYAIIEIINNNKSYLKFKDSPIITNLLHFAEVYYFLLLNYNEKTADYWASNLKFTFLDITQDIAIKASRFKFKNQKLKLSYADCIGYITSQENNLKFLTGDKQFKDMNNVEFVR